MLRNSLIFCLLLSFSQPAAGSGYLAELPDYLVDLRLVFEGILPNPNNYLQKISQNPVEIEQSCKVCSRDRTLKLIPAPLPPEDPYAAMPMPEPQPTKPYEVSAGADPVMPNLVIGGKRLSDKELQKALLDPEELLSVFEKDISKAGGPEERIHIPLTMPYDNTHPQDKPRVPSKAVYIRE